MRTTQTPMHWCACRRLAPLARRRSRPALRFRAHEALAAWLNSAAAGLMPPIDGGHIDLNPHQLAAALFALDALPRGGAILADEVGLGKTIEAGLVMAQQYMTGTRRQIVLVPAALRLQWLRELEDKFGLPSRVLTRADFATPEAARAALLAGGAAILSYQLAYRQRELISRAGFGLCVCDEAHRLRNAWRPESKVARGLRDYLAGIPKLLLTATPLQNSLLDLYALTTFIDPRLLGSYDAFCARYLEPDGRSAKDVDHLLPRLQSVLHRTLRSQVKNRIRFTNRHAITQRFQLTPPERALYDGVSAYLRRPRLAAVEPHNRALFTMVYRKLLASSSFAIAATLDALLAKLQALRSQIALPWGYEEAFAGYDVPASWDDNPGTEALEDGGPEPFTAHDIDSETQVLRRLRDLAVSIRVNAKGEALLQALSEALEHARASGNPRLAPKAVIFTESVRTQRYLLRLLESHGYDGAVSLFAGVNQGPLALRAYRRWLDAQSPQEAAAAARMPAAVAMRHAILWEFAHHSAILVTTDAGAEGLNLQFCNLVINYDLPWNPQRIEQRIGRCHRYGQTRDVAVLNLLNEDNLIDQRVYEILEHKLQLFEGCFGASDHILGALGDGIAFEHTLLEIYQHCRTPDAIAEAFANLEARFAPAETSQAAVLETMAGRLDREVQARIGAAEAETAGATAANAQLAELEATARPRPPGESPLAYLEDLAAPGGEPVTARIAVAADGGFALQPGDHGFVRAAVLSLPASRTREVVAWGVRAQGVSFVPLTAAQAREIIIHGAALHGTGEPVPVSARVLLDSAYDALLREAAQRDAIQRGLDLDREACLIDSFYSDAALALQAKSERLAAGLEEARRALAAAPATSREAARAHYRRLEHEYRHARHQQFAEEMTLFERRDRDLEKLRARDGNATGEIIVTAAFTAEAGG